MIFNLQRNDPVCSIGNACQAEDDELPEEVIAKCNRMLDIQQCGWLENRAQRRETQLLCALVRLEWNSEEKQKPATATKQLLEKGNLEDAALLLGFEPVADRVRLLVTLLEAMLKAPHMTAEEHQFMFGGAQ